MTILVTGSTGTIGEGARATSTWKKAERARRNATAL
jgi:hypothetical protein